MFIEGQDSAKKELLKCFPTEYFSQIDDIFPEEEEDEDEQEERQSEDNPPNRASIDNVIEIDENITEAQEEATEDVPAAM